MVVTGMSEFSLDPQGSLMTPPCAEGWLIRPSARSRVRRDHDRDRDR